MAVQVKPGDVVRLKSGGPAMTVTGLGGPSGSHLLLCKWFDEKEGRFLQDEFTPASLMAADGTAPGDRNTACG
jgi:uncharacterized protein YodC (DUF2158 family)